MFNKITLMTALLFFLFFTNVSAHSHLEDSTPQNGEVLTESASNITLTFETNIEATSTFTLLDAEGKTVTLPEVQINGSQLGAQLETNLPNGAYTIHWKIIGEDGHPLEGDIPFSVDIPESVEKSAQENNASTTEQASGDTEKEASKEIVKEQAVTKSADPEVEPGLKNYIIPGLIALIIVLGFSSYWLIFKRKTS
nr:copper resistance CopC family protein [Neobacillus sp. Marseille-Q6967]